MSGSGVTWGRWWQGRITLTCPDLPGFADLAVRELRGGDFVALDRLRVSDRKWLAPWEATTPPGNTPLTMAGYLARIRREQRSGQAIYFGILVQGNLAGQVSLSGIQRGASQSGTIGYWIHSRFAGHGYTPAAVALVGDWAFEQARLHRLEINIRPENAPSLRVAQKLRLRYEGQRRGLVHIAGQWADHESYAVVAEEVGGRLIDRLR